MASGTDAALQHCASVLAGTEHVKCFKNNRFLLGSVGCLI